MIVNEGLTNRVAFEPKPEVRERSMREWVKAIQAKTEKY